MCLSGTPLWRASLGRLFGALLWCASLARPFGAPQCRASLVRRLGVSISVMCAPGWLRTRSSSLLSTRAIMIVGYSGGLSVVGSEKANNSFSSMHDEQPRCRLLMSVAPSNLHQASLSRYRQGILVWGDWRRRGQGLPRPFQACLQAVL